MAAVRQLRFYDCFLRCVGICQPTQEGLRHCSKSLIHIDNPLTTELHLLEFNPNCGLQFTFLGGLGVGFQEMISIIMAALVCDPGDIGLASGFLGSMKQVSGTIASKLPFALEMHSLREYPFIRRVSVCT